MTAEEYVATTCIALEPYEGALPLTLGEAAGYVEALRMISQMAPPKELEEFHLTQMAVTQWWEKQTRTYAPDTSLDVFIDDNPLVGWELYALLDEQLAAWTRLAPTIMNLFDRPECPWAYRPQPGIIVTPIPAAPTMPGQLTVREYVEACPIWPLEAGAANWGEVHSAAEAILLSLRQRVPPTELRGWHEEAVSMTQWVVDVAGQAEPDRPSTTQPLYTRRTSRPDPSRGFDLIISMRHVERDMDQLLWEVLYRYECTIFSPDDLGGHTQFPALTTAPLIAQVIGALLGTLFDPDSA